MNGRNNLIKAEDLTSAELRERAQKGGIASGKARREKKLMKETLEMFLTMPIKNGKFADVEGIRSFAALKGKNISVQEAIMIAQIQKAMKGDTKASEFVRDTIGQKPVESVAMSGEVNNPFAGLTTEELKKMVYNE